MIKKFESMDIVQIPRSQNYRANILARMAATTDSKMPKSVPMEVMSSPNIVQSLEMMQIDQKGLWIHPIILYILDGMLPADKT